jgi:glyoxylase-like metal-dependent hydrolase (beta-lactamase superfamily II)
MELMSMTPSTKSHNLLTLLTMLTMAAAGWGCSGANAPTVKSLAADAVTAMGGAAKLQSIRTITMKDGAGTREQLQESVHVGDRERPAKLTKVSEIVDLAGGRASFDYEIDNAGFVQHRHEVLTKRGDKLVGLDYVGMRPVVATSVGGLFSWGTQNSPEIALRRNLLDILLTAAQSGSETVATDKDFGGKTSKAATAKTKSGEDVTLYFDPQSKLLAGFETTDSEAMAGDVPAQYVFADYKSVDGVMLPHKITITKNGKPYSDVQYTSAAINDSAAEKDFEIPEAASKQADQAIAEGDFSPVAVTKIGDGTYFARAYSHNSMIVEFPAWLAVVEAPYTDAQSATLVRVLEQQFPGKPVKYAAVTHHHSDHIGGVRGIAAAGATVVVEKGHEAPLRSMLDAHFTHPPDALERKRNTGQSVGGIEVYEGKKVLSDGNQTLELYAFGGSPHADPMVLAYVPGSKALFQSDLWFPGTGGAGSPDSAQLLQSIRTLRLKPAINVGGHGGVAPFAELEKAIASMK